MLNLLLLVAVQAPAAPSELGAPRVLHAGDAPIDVTTGHAAPYVIDFDGDGVRDLLVGEYGVGSFDVERLPESVAEKGLGFSEGKLRVYRNLGTDAAPRFEDFAYLRAGKELATIPTT